VILLTLAVAWLGGLIIAALGGGGFWPAWLVAGAVTAIALLVVRRPALSLLVIACSLLAVGAAIRYESAYPSSTQTGVALSNGGAAITLTGTVLTEPEERV
jgi:hypothetical protein